ncbi:MAG: pyruvate, water dikinase regulatory protein [Anaerolineae bacterium]
MSTEKQQPPAPPIIIVTGGVGTSGEQVVNTVLAQFQDATVPVEIIPSVRELAGIEDAVTQAEATRGTIVHTLVDAKLRHHMIEVANRRGVVALDLMGPLINRLETVLGQEALGRPGFYRHLRRSYFDRIGAIEYAVAHDDGVKPEDWSDADILLIGVSRTGKTPLSMYLSVIGWKTANMPIVPQIPIPDELYEVKRSRVIGLTMDVDRLVVFRRDRARRLGMPIHSDYASALGVSKELNFARRIFRRGGFYVLDVTDKPVEASADEVIRYMEQVELAES